MRAPFAPAARAEFSAVGKINNFYGQMVARIAPIDGVIAYDRDRVIDLRAAPAPTPAPAP